ncbi:hypothetical protein [Rhizobium sp. AG855]|uniref:hypothetical protein n=1 Tax=Rhizobium sp. AG855 TaxID=2183898 RepID=UPI0011C3FBA6|nr:hypothetical protein [Rhizobium sp. AG855]
MNGQIDIPQQNLINIPLFDSEPDEALLAEIKQHIRETQRPHTWRGHSHTKPPQGAFVVYCDEFNVAAPDTVERVAPCPCCNPFHPQYKNSGKVAWFPDEKVIRLIGPLCFKRINATGHESALVELRKKMKARRELEVIKAHIPTIQAVIDSIDALVPIGEALDEFRDDFNRALDHDLNLPFFRAARMGVLTVAERTIVPVVRADGSVGQRVEERPTAFATVVGYSMYDRSGPVAAKKRLAPLRSALVEIAARLSASGDLEKLSEAERVRFAESLPASRDKLAEVLEDAGAKQSFLTSGTIDTLAQWGRHPHALHQFSIQRKRNVIIMSSSRQRSEGHVTIRVPPEALAHLPSLPAI